jgi:hypothetical protein
MLVLGLFTSAASGQILWNESTQGDLSGDRLVPTALSLSTGSNLLTATSGPGDREYLTFTIPTGKVLSGITLVSYAGLDGTAFLGIQQGSVFTEPPSGTVVGNLLGYAHFGTGPGTVGGNILPAVGQGAGAQGFTAPLPAASYAVWLQQLGSPATYQFNFAVTAVPEPSQVGMAVGGLLLAAAVVQRSRKAR